MTKPERVVPDRAALQKTMDRFRLRGVEAWLRALVRANEFFLIPLALVIGLITGAVVTIMSEIAQIAHVVIYGIPIDVHLSANDWVNPIIAVAAPTLGGLILGWMEWSRRRWSLSNAVDPIEANALRGGQLSLRDSLVVSSQTLISNGSGASVGLEAGYTQIGAGAASLLGRLLKLRRNDLRLIVGCGAAAAIAAAFGAPLTGAFYACELIVGVYSVSSAAPVLIASIAGALTAKWLGGAPYLLDVPQVSAVAGEQYVAIIVLALVVSSIGILVMQLSAVVERAFNQRWLPVWIKPGIGGLCIGGMAIITPQILAAGHGAMLLDLHHEMAMTVIVTIICLKICACLISLASGFRGGLFFASLFIGCLIGKLFALVLPMVSAGLVLDSTTSMLAGMATMGVAIVGGPLTMSFLVLETTRSLDLTAGVLAACIVTSVFVRAVFGHSFSTWRLHLRGETIRSANDVGWLRNLSVERMMRTDPTIVDGSATVATSRREFPLGSRQAIFVADSDGRYRGVVMLPDLFASSLDGTAEGTRVFELARLPDKFLYRTVNVKAAMRAFDQAEAEVLAVVESKATPRIVGYLTEAYARRRYAEELDQATRGIVG
jgi:CIC family chloride channel protein